MQDPKSAEIPIMPQAAIRAVPNTEVLPLGAMAQRLIELSLDQAKISAGRSA